MLDDTQRQEVRALKRRMVTLKALFIPLFELETYALPGEGFTRRITRLPHGGRWQLYQPAGAAAAD